MKATTSIETTAKVNAKDNQVNVAKQASREQEGAVDRGPGRGKPESELRAAARRKGLTLKELADKMGVSYGYLSQVSAGSRSWTPMLRERAQAVLGEVPGQGVVYRQGGLVTGESTCIRERAREAGLSLKGLAEHVGVSASYMTQVCRGQRHMSPGVQAKVEAALEAPAKMEAAQCPTVDPRALWDRMAAHGYSQNQVARLAGISSGHLSLIMNGQRTPSGDVLLLRHEVLFRPTAAELVALVELKVRAWKKDDRKRVVVRGAGGPHSRRNPGAGTVCIGGRVPGEEVEYAYTSGYDSKGRVSVNHIVDERGYGVMLAKNGAGRLYHATRERRPPLTQRRYSPASRVIESCRYVGSSPFLLLPGTGPAARLGWRTANRPPPPACASP